MTQFRIRVLKYAHNNQCPIKNNLNMSLAESMYPVLYYILHINNEQKYENI